MSLYALIKMIHILSASVLFGTGAGIAFFMFRAHLSGDKQSFISTSRAVVLADWLFTAPAVVVQLLCSFNRRGTHYLCGRGANLITGFIYRKGIREQRTTTRYVSAQVSVTSI